MNMQKAEELAYKVINDHGGAFLMALGYIGDQLGLFKSLESEGAVTSTELATPPASMTAMSANGSRPWSPPNTSISTPIPAATS
jgi:hypothetical protein